ncbi:hypothetical protein [Achromobacter dolens]|uniref:hypothetical protein n=1 Tax=Achromobacter dolens TaxID=1287738 RepID=UPI003B968F29
MRRTAAPGAAQPHPATRVPRSRRARGVAALILAALLPLAARAQTPLPDPYDYDEPAPAPKRVVVPRWQTLELGKPGHRYKIPVYANRNLARGDLRDIKQIVIVFHGVKRNADAYYETVATVLAANPARANDTLILAPRFVGSIDSGFAGMAAWRKAGWEDGEDSVQANGRPAPVSSFQVIDDLLRSLDDRKRLPILAGIVLAGHSGGGQLVQRYAVLNQIDGPLRRDGIAVRYVIANPSSYLYLTRERPRPDGKGYAPYERGICPTYNQYKYGTDKLPAYAQETDDTRLFIRYAARDVTYLLGGADNNPEHRLLDKTCGAEAQGATRLARGTAYLQYERIVAARGSRPVTLHRAGFEVTGIGHDNKGMFQSVCGARALFGDDAQAPAGAAACTVIEPPRK